MQRELLVNWAEGNVTLINGFWISLPVCNLSRASVTRCPMGTHQHVRGSDKDLLSLRTDRCVESYPAETLYPETKAD